MSDRRFTIDGRELTVSHAERPLFVEDGITKGDLCGYYQRVATVMLPHLEDRILSMERYPEGIGSEGFFQKEVPEHFPEWVRTVEVEKEGGRLRQVVADSAATLVFLAGQACITPHGWLSRASRRHRPDRMIFDLDPSGAAGVEDLRWTARLLRELLQEVGLTPFLTTTGSRGFHVVAPLAPRAGFDEVRAVARRLASYLANRHPERLTLSQRKRGRGDRIFLDYLRNAYAQTAVAPYAVRARPGAPVATPIEWDELAGTEPRSYGISNLFRRLGQKADPWLHIEDHAGTLDGALARFG